MMHPAVLASFIEGFSHYPNMKTFAVLEVDASSDNRAAFRTKAAQEDRDKQQGRFNNNNRQGTPTAAGSGGAVSFFERYAAELRAYNVSEAEKTLRIVDHSSSFVASLFAASHNNGGGPCSLPNGSCRSTLVGGLLPPQQKKKPHCTVVNRLLCEVPKKQLLCDDRELAERLSHRAETSLSYAEQMFKIGVCWKMVEAYEEAHSTMVGNTYNHIKKEDKFKFAWVLRWRPDAMLLRPFPLLRDLKQDDGESVYLHHRTKDIFFACPRHLCSPYFSIAQKAQLNCSTGPDFGYSGAAEGGGKVGFVGVHRDHLHFLAVSFALLRPQGPVCGMEGDGPTTAPRHGDPCLRAAATIAAYDQSSSSSSSSSSAVSSSSSSSSNDVGHQIKELAHCGKEGLVQEIEQILRDEPGWSTSLLVPEVASTAPIKRLHGRGRREGG
jgi:hypothetical protein